MKFGVGVDYSLKALLMLAERYPGTQPVRVEEIAETQGIPENYLRRLLIELKRGGLVASQKGPSGGDMFGRPPARGTQGGVVGIKQGGGKTAERLGKKHGPPPPAPPIPRGQRSGAVPAPGHG